MTTTKIQILRDALMIHHAAGMREGAAAGSLGEQLGGAYRASRTRAITDEALRLTEGAQDAPGEAVTVKADRNRVWITKGVQSFMLAHEADTAEELEWYADMLRGALAGNPAPKASTEPVAEAVYWKTPVSQGWEFAWFGEKPAMGETVKLYAKQSGRAAPNVAINQTLSCDKEAFEQRQQAILSAPAPKTGTEPASAMGILQDEPAPNCTRSHPHEDMSAACEAKTVQARADFKRAGIEHAKRAEGERVFTAIFRIPATEAPDVATALCGHPYWSAGSWSHALDDRDDARAALGQQQAGVPDGVEREARVRFALDKLRNEEAFEARVERMVGLIKAAHKFDWPYTDAFDDGGMAYCEAKRRLAAAPTTPEAAP